LQSLISNVQEETMEHWVVLLSIFSLLHGSIDAFAPTTRSIAASNTHAPPSTLYFSATSPTRLSAKLWDRLEIEEDDEPFWYLLNCVAGLELDLLNQCRAKCGDMPDALKFVVPTERKTRSHGANRMVTETKVKYPGYVFAKLRLCPQVYEAIQELDLCRSWMGTVNHKGYKKLPPAPLALNELEVENFGLEEEKFEDDQEEVDEDAVIVDSEEEELEIKDPVDEEALRVYQGLKVEDMIKVTAKNKFFNEDGIVRRLKDGKIFVRFYTYGTSYEEWLDPSDVRKLDGEELLRGLSGPSQPVTQRDFEEPQDSRDPINRRHTGLRQGLMGNVRGTRVPRNTSRDRESRDNRDLFGRTDEERRREEKNWKWYQEQQRKKDGRAPVSGQVDDEWNFHGQSRRNVDDNDSELRDVDAQWGRQSQRQRRREQRPRNVAEPRRVQNAFDGQDDWSTFVSPASAPAKSEEDAFFASLMEDLSDDLGASSSDRGTIAKKSQKKSTKDDDDFFASLMSELSDEGVTINTKADSGSKDTSGGEDDFFAALEAELGTAFVGKSQISAEDSDDFFAKLEAELNPEKSDKALDSTGDESFPDFELSDFAEPSRHIESVNVAPETAAVHSPPLAAKRDSSSGDLSKNTVTQLKEMLREKGLKVSGKKSELIDRLMQGQN
jgi:transcription antitermination factor NusG